MQLESRATRFLGQGVRLGEGQNSWLLPPLQNAQGRLNTSGHVSLVTEVVTFLDYNAIQVNQR